MPEKNKGGKNLILPKAIIYQKKFAAKPSYKGKTMINIYIGYPQIEMKSNQDSANVINEFYKNSARETYDYASGELFNNAKKEYIYDLQQKIPFRVYELKQTFEVTYNHGSLLSLYRDKYEYTGGAHGNTDRTSNTWHLQNGFEMKLSDFFVGSYYKSIIYDYITKEIKRQIKNGETFYFDDYAKNVFRYFDEKNFYLTSTGFAIYYPLYTIAAYAQGIPVFEIPYSIFGSELKQNLFV